MTFDEEIVKKTVQFGILEYPLSKCLNILDFENEALRDAYAADFQDDKSQIFANYKKGKDLADFAFDTKLFEMGRAGDMKAMQKFEEKKRLRKLK